MMESVCLTDEEDKQEEFVFDDIKSARETKNALMKMKTIKSKRFVDYEGFGFINDM